MIAAIQMLQQREYFLHLILTQALHKQVKFYKERKHFLKLFSLETIMLNYTSSSPNYNSFL